MSNKSDEIIGGARNMRGSTPDDDHSKEEETTEGLSRVRQAAKPWARSQEERGIQMETHPHSCLRTLYVNKGEVGDKCFGAVRVVVSCVTAGTNLGLAMFMDVSLIAAGDSRLLACKSEKPHVGHATSILNQFR